MALIKLEDVGKKFILTYKVDNLSKEFFYSSGAHEVSSEFWALKGVNIEVEKGQVIGIVGRNGAGKSTLLSILAGVSSPTTGKVQVNGRVSSLLTLGAGFQDELTGRENIFLNSSILGINRSQVNKKYRSIVEFSELDGFLDSQIQTYSQGMRLRLGFSIAIHMDFDILLIDEILSVGDVSFQKKCFDKIEEFRRQGKAMIITTQDLGVIERLCAEAYLLENGEVVQRGHPQKVVERYLKLLGEKKLSEAFQQRYWKLRWWADKRFWGKREGSKEARITDVKTYNAKGQEANQFKPGDKAIIKACFVVDEEIDQPHFGIALFREDGLYCYGPNTLFDGHEIVKLHKGNGSFSVEYKSLDLKPGKYRISLAIWDKNEVWAYDYHIGFYEFEIIGENRDMQLLDLRYKWEPQNQWKKSKIPQLETEDSFFNLNIHRQAEINSSDIEVSSIELLDSSDTPKNIFHTGEDLKLKLRLKFLKPPEDHRLWLGLFRMDEVYCHGVSKRIREEEVTLFYPGLPLLTGDYYFSLGLLGKNKKAFLLYRHKAAVFKMSFLGQDHGTVYLKHSWDWDIPVGEKL